MTRASGSQAARGEAARGEAARAPRRVPCGRLRGVLASDSGPFGPFSCLWCLVLATAVAGEAEGQGRARRDSRSLNASRPEGTGGRRGFSVLPK